MVPILLLQIHCIFCFFFPLGVFALKLWVSTGNSLTILLVLLAFSASALLQAWPLHLGTSRLFPCSNFYPCNLLLYALAHDSHIPCSQRHLLLSLALPLLKSFHNSSLVGHRIFWECQLVIKMQTQSHTARWMGMLYIKYISTGLRVAMAIFLCISVSLCVFSSPSLWAKVSALSALGNRMLLCGELPFQIWDLQIFTEAEVCRLLLSLLDIKKITWEMFTFLILCLLVVHDRHLHRETTLQRADGGALLLVMRDSILTKEFYSPLYFSCILQTFSPLFFPFIFSWTVYNGLGHSLMAFCSLISISSELIINLFSYPLLGCIRVMALESNSYQLGYLCCLCRWWQGVIMRMHLWIPELLSSSFFQQRLCLVVLWSRCVTLDNSDYGKGSLIHDLWSWMN